MNILTIYMASFFDIYYPFNLYFGGLIKPFQTKKPVHATN
jgi:hypothetical protein